MIAPNPRRSNPPSESTFTPLARDLSTINAALHDVRFRRMKTDRGRRIARRLALHVQLLLKSEGATTSFAIGTEARRA